MKKFLKLCLFILLFMRGQAQENQKIRLGLPLGHTDQVNTAQFSPDGKILVTGSSDNTVKIWDAASGKLLKDFVKFKSEVLSAQFSPDGKSVIIVCEDDSTARIIEAKSGKIQQNLIGHNYWITSAQFSPNGKFLISAAEDMTAKIWEVATGKILQNLTGHSDIVCSARFSSDGGSVVTASADNTAKVWNVATGQLLQDLKGHTFNVNYAEFSPNGKSIVTASDDGTSKIWDVSSGKILQDLGVNDNSVWSAHFSPDGKLIMSNGSKIWDVASGMLLKELTFYGLGTTLAHVNSAQFSKDGRTIVTGSSDNTARIWDVATGKILLNLKGHNKGVLSAEFSPDGNSILTASEDETAKIWDLYSGQLLQDLTGHTDPFGFAQFSPDGKLILTTSKAYTAKIWNMNDWTLLQVLAGHNSYVTSAEFSPDGRSIVTASFDHTAKIWDVSTGKMLQEFNGHNDRVNFVQFSPDGKSIVTASEDETARVWDATSGQLIRELIGHTAPVRSALFSPNGKSIVTASEDGTVKIWDTSTGKKRLELIRLSRKTYSAQFTPDGKKIVTNGAEGTRIWDTDTGELLNVLKIHTDFVRSTQFSSDATKILSVSRDNTVKLYDLVTGKLLKDLLGHNDWIITAQFSSDEKAILTVGGDHKTILWDASTGKMLYTRIQLTNNDWLVYDEHYRYDGTPGARDYLYFVCGTEIIDLAQMKDALYVPGLVEKIMNGEQINYPKLSELDICEALPLVEQLESVTADYQYKITPRKLGLEQVEVYVNDKRIFTFSKRELAQQGADYMLELSEGQLNPHFIAGRENKIRVIGTVITQEGNELKSRGVVQVSSAKEEGQLSPPKLFAVMVGVNEYKDPDLKLNYPAKDAQDLGKALELSASKLLGKENVFLYSVYTGTGNKERFSTPEKEGIRKALEDIGKKARPEDVIVLFFAGHGVMQGADEKLFTFLTAEASNLNLTGINTKELQEWLSYEGPHKILANKSILIFDACNSGQATKELMALARSDDDTRRIRQVEDLKDKSGMFILAASAANQAAYELPQYEQGLLTYSMLSVLKSNPDILDAGGCLNVQKWFLESEKYLKNLVESHGYKQDAQPFGTANICIGNVDEEVRNGIVLAKEKPTILCANALNGETFNDDLQLKAFINQKLSDISERGVGSKVVFVNSETPEVNKININYRVSKDEVICDVRLFKNNKLLHQAQVKGKQNDLNDLAQKVIDALVLHVK